MSSQFDSLLDRQLDMAREWGLMGIALTQSVLDMQISQSNAWLARNTGRLQDALSESPEQWPDPLQSSLHEAMVSARESLRLASAIQAQTMRIVERQTRDAQTLLAEVEALLTEAAADTGSAISIKGARKPARRPAREAHQEQRLAA